MKEIKHLRVVEGLAASLGEFLSAEGIALGVTADGPGDVEVVPGRSDDRVECTTETIHAGGWVPCPTAFQLAGKLGISKADAGKLMDKLGVKVRQCSLGCF